MRSASPMAWAWAASSASRRSRTRSGSTSAPRLVKCSAPSRDQRSTTSAPSLTAAIIGSGIVFLDGTIVTLALPKIGQLPTSVLGVLEGQLYVQVGYLAVLSALLILAGALGDYYGRRKI